MWTESIPTVEGYYWVQQLDSPEKEPHIAKLWFLRSNSDPQLELIGSDEGDHPKYYRFWSERLQAPTTESHNS